MTQPVRTFGEIASGVEYVLRPGGYAVICRPGGDIAVVSSPRGHYLPGGGQNPGESPADAAIREASEECGLQIRIRELIGMADQYVFSGEEKAGFQKRCTFFLAEADPEPCGIGEADHVLYWLRPDEAAKCLRHESQRWAVTESNQFLRR
jgi:8-oxo-dGTP diphosphatase